MTMNIVYGLVAAGLLALLFAFFLAGTKVIKYSAIAMAIVIFLVAGIGSFYVGGDTKSQTAESTIQSTEQAIVAIAEENELEDKRFLQQKSDNPKMKVMIADGYSLPEKTDKALEEMLNYMRHDVEVLRGTAYARGVQGVPEQKDLLVEINGKRYLNQKGRDLYFFLEASLLDKDTKATSIVTPVGFTAVNSGQVDGVFTTTSSPQDLSGRKATRIEFADNTIIYVLNYCGNFLFPTPPSDVPTSPKIPEPPVDEKPPKPTPENPVTPPTPEPPQPSPKKIEDAPQRNPKVIKKDTNNLRPGANGPEDAKVNVSPGTEYQGDSYAEVEKQQKAAEEAAKAEEERKKKAEAEAKAQHEAAQAAAAEELARQQKAAEEAAKKAQEITDAEARRKAEEEARKQAERVENEKQAQNEVNDGEVDGF